MRQNKRNGRGLAVWMLAGAMGAVTPAFLPSAAVAADAEMKDVAESKVPPAVVQAARQQYLDSRDVVYRRSTEGRESYVVNFTTPQNIRMQTRISADGTTEGDPRLAPNQPDNAPKRDERERLAADWTARVRENARMIRPGTQPPAAPIPSIVPGAPLDPTAIPGVPMDPISTPIAAADLPPGVLQSMDQYTNGARDIRYYRQQVENRSRYEAHYTHPDGSRREVLIDGTGSRLAGPLVLRDTVEPRDLEADRPEGQQATQTTQLSARDVPAAVMRQFDRYTQRATQVNYRRDTYGDRTSAYVVHYVLPDNGRRYWASATEDGTLRVAPRLSSFQPNSDMDPEGNRSARVQFADLPDRVKQALDPITRRDRNAVYYRQVRDNKTSYGSQYAENGQQMWVRVDEGGRTIAGPVSATTGRPLGDRDARTPAADRDRTVDRDRPAVDRDRPTADRDRPAGRDPVPAADQLPADMRRDRVNFADMPKAVQTRVLRESEGGQNIVNMRREENGRPVYVTVWNDRDGRRQELRLNERGEPITAPRAR